MLKVSKSDVVYLLKNLIKINSVNPHMNGKGEGEISNFIANYLESFGVEVDMQKVADDRFNVIGILRGESDGPNLMLNGHSDTVGFEDMKIDPFVPFIENDNIHGRGACDMKGPLAGMIIAVKTLTHSDIRLKGNLLFSAVVDEEYKSIGTEKLIKKYQPDAVIVGEPTNFEIAISHKGFVWLEIVTYGKAAHGSIPEAGVDAITNMSKIISRICKLKKTYSNKRHKLVGTPKIHTSTIEGGTEWSVIPALCRLQLERRTIPGETSSMVFEEINQVINELSIENSSFKAGANVIFERLPMEIDYNEKIVKDLKLAIKEVRRIEPNISGQPYWTDASIFVNNANIPTCLFGPGDIRLAHSRDEYVSINDIINSAKIYTSLAQIFCETLSTKD